jgi:hypothetical protein
LNRRRFLRYGVATAAVAGASALGLEWAQAGTAFPVAMLPKITALRYEPSKVVNSKIYDIKVDIEFSGPVGQLSSVKVALEPVVYAHLPTQAFPNEQPKVNAVQPTGLESRILSTQFTDLKGGREYDLKAVTSDPSGTIDEKTLRTEYVREFENIAALGHTTVIADYYPWYEKPSQLGNHWRIQDGINAPSQHVYTPLLGEYASGDQIVISKHIDWATGHGINAFCMSWHSTGKNDTTYMGWNAHITANMDAFLKNPLAKQMQFCILYENNDRMKEGPESFVQDFDDPFNRKRLLSDFTFLDSYFKQQNYLKVNGKCYVRFDFTLPFIGDFEGVLSTAREAAQKNGYELLLACDLMGRSWSPYYTEGPLEGHWIVDESFYRRMVGAFDGISASCFPSDNPDLEEESTQIRSSYDEWKAFGNKFGKHFIPIAWPGHGVAAPLRRDPLRLETEIKIALEYGNIVEIVAFNDWILGQGIEPSVEEGFSYLEAVKRAIGF